MTRNGYVVLLAFASCGMLVHVSPSWGADPTPEEQSISLGVDWLRSQQIRTGDYASGLGSWNKDPAITSLAVLAMLNAGYKEDDPIVHDGVQFLLTEINANGSVFDQANRFTYYTSIAIMPFVATRNDAYKPTVALLQSWLIESQWDDDSFYGAVTEDNWYWGGFGYGNGERPDLSNTQWALMGLRAADDWLGTDATDTYTKALVWLKRRMNPDGGSNYAPEAPNSIHTMTAAAAWSYALCGLTPGLGNELDQSLTWLDSHYSVANVDGWGGRFEYYYSITLAKALVMSHKSRLGAHDWFVDLSAFLISRQDPTGHWPYTGLGGSMDTTEKDWGMNTCWAVLAMQTRTLPAGANLSMSMILASHADLHVYDPEGRHVGIDYDTNTIELGIEGATYKLLDGADQEVPFTGSPIPDGLRQIITLPVLTAGAYRVELIGTSDGAYQLTINGMQDDVVVQTRVFEGDVTEGERLATNATATAMEGALTLLYEDVTRLPVLGLTPDEFPNVVVAAGEAAKDLVFTVSEVGSLDPLHSVSMFAQDLVGASDTILGATVTFSENHFDLAAGESREITATITLPGELHPPYDGSIVVESTDGGTKLIPVKLDFDDDGDGVVNALDNCRAIANEDQADADADGIGDVCDNCPNTANPGQTDTDEDGVGDACDNCPDVASPAQEDQDEDGIGDVCDNCPDVPNVSQEDQDADGLGDACDNCWSTANPDQEDGDDDGVGDGCDNCPAHANFSQVDGDGDGIGDACDNCPADANADQANGDEDGAGDACDLCPDSADKTEPGDCGCNAPDVDSDDDGTLDCNDACPDDPDKSEEGVCGCGVADTDADGDGALDCHDACPDDADKTQAGECGCGVAETDTDGDDVPNCIDNCPEDSNPDQDPAACQTVCGSAGPALLAMTALGLLMIRRTPARRRP